MTSAIRINHFEKKISISKSFQKAAMNPTSKEYAKLMEVMANHPNYALDQRSIKTNPKKETYAGLTYEYMRDYIRRYSNDVTYDLNELENKIFDSKCHSKGKRYPTIKKWFLVKYPDVKEFLKAEMKAKKEAENTSFDIPTEKVA